MATYLEMQTRIAGELNRSNLTQEIRSAILSAIEYYGKRRWWFNEYADTLATVASTEYVALPSDFIEMDVLQVTIGSNNRELKLRDISEITQWRSTSSSGQPSDYCLYQNRIELYPTPSAIYSLPIKYIKSLTVLSADANTNAWTTELEELIRLHAKKDLLANKIHDTASAKDMQALSDSALYRLESLNTRRTTTGRTRSFYL